MFRILEAIEATPSGLGLKSICDATRLNKSTAHRFLKHLEREGYLIRADGGKYLIGPKLSQMGARADHRATLQAVSRPILSELWKSTRETVNLATLDQGNVLYIEVLESPHEFRLSSRVGSRRSLHATALGESAGGFPGRKASGTNPERIEFSGAHAEHDHESGAIPPGTRESPAAGICS